ncbi:MAG: phage terminase large subunit [Pseudomonadota bacterium]
MIQQRLHEDDLAGHLLEQGGWHHLNLPAVATSDETISLVNGYTYKRKEGDVLHPERQSRTNLDALKSDMGHFHFEAQYQQAPVPEAGNLISPDWFKRHHSSELDQMTGHIIQSWDFAIEAGSNNDYSVCITAKRSGNRLYLIDVLRKRLNYPDQKKTLIALAQKHRASTILVEKAANGHALLSDLRQINAPQVPTPLGIIPRGSKEARLSVVSSRIEAGDVSLPEQANWIDDFLHEVAAFPNGRHDDQVDALTQMLDWLNSYQHDYEGVADGPKAFIVTADDVCDDDYY